MNQSIDKVAVLGAGVMGAQIAGHFANAGVPGLLYDINPVSYTHLTLPTTPYV